MWHTDDPETSQGLSDDELSDDSSECRKCNWHNNKMSTDYYRKSYSIADALRMMPNRKCSSVHFLKFAPGVHPHSRNLEREKSTDTVSISQSEKKADISASYTCPDPSSSSVRSETLDYIDMLACLKPDASLSAVPSSSRMSQIEAKSDDRDAEVTRDEGPIPAPPPEVTTDKPSVGSFMNHQPEPLSANESDTERTEEVLPSSRMRQIEAISDDRDAEVTRDEGPISAPPPEVTRDEPSVGSSMTHQPEPFSAKESDTERTEERIEALPKSSSEGILSLDISSLKSHVNDISINSKIEALPSLETDYSRLLRELEVEFPSLGKNERDLSLLLECTETNSTLATATQVYDVVLKCSSTTITDDTLGSNTLEINMKMSVASIRDAHKVDDEDRNPAMLFKCESKLSCHNASLTEKASEDDVNVEIDGKVSASSFNFFHLQAPLENGELVRSSSKVSLTTLSASGPGSSNVAFETTSNPIFSSNIEDSGIQSMTPTISCASLSQASKIKTAQLKSRSECNTLSTGLADNNATSAEKGKVNKGLLERRAAFGTPGKINTRLKPRPKMTTKRESPNNLTPEGVDSKSKPQQKVSPIRKPQSSTKYKVTGRFSSSSPRKSSTEKPKVAKPGKNSSQSVDRAEVTSERPKISQTSLTPRSSTWSNSKTAGEGIRKYYGLNKYTKDDDPVAQKSKQIKLDCNPHDSPKRANETQSPKKNVQAQESNAKYQSVPAKPTWKYNSATQNTKLVSSIPKSPPFSTCRSKSKIPSLIKVVNGRLSPKTNKVYVGIPTVSSTTSSVDTIVPHGTISLPVSHVSDTIASSSKTSAANKGVSECGVPQLDKANDKALTNSKVNQFSTEMLYKSICADIEASLSVVNQSLEQSPSPSIHSSWLRSRDTMNCLLGTSSSKIEVAKCSSTKKSKNVKNPKRPLILRKKKRKHRKTKLQTLKSHTSSSAAPKQIKILAKKLRRTAYYRSRLLKQISFCKYLIPAIKKLKRSQFSNILHKSNTWASIGSSVNTSKSKSSVYSSKQNKISSIKMNLSTIKKCTSKSSFPETVRVGNQKVGKNINAIKKTIPPAPFDSDEVVTPSRNKSKEKLKPLAMIEPKLQTVPPQEYVANFFFSKKKKASAKKDDESNISPRSEPKIEPEAASTSETFTVEKVYSKPSSSSRVIADEPVCTYKIIGNDQIPESAKVLLKKKHSKSGKSMQQKFDMLRTDLENTRSKLSTGSAGSSDTFTKSSSEKFVSVKSISDELMKRDYPCLNAIVSKSIYFESLDTLGEGDAVPNTSGELPVDRARSNRSTSIRRSRMLKTYRDLDPSDIIMKIRRIRNKLAEASKWGLRPIGDHRGRRRLRAWNYGFAVCTVYHLGEKGSGLRSRGDVQDFYELRDEHLSNGTLFEDPDFPADDSSLFFSRRPDRHYEWLRPGEIVDDPQLFVEGYSRFDVQQGELGDCWLLAAVANLTLYRRLFFQIVPDDQGFEEKYAGIFHFRFWQYGRWIDVVIDDRLPTYRGQLVFLHSTEENEFWSALLEKAYAKLHGSYEALKGGSTCEAMEDFTGGVTEMYEMNATPPNLFKIILKAYERGSLMGASLEPDPAVLEAETEDGLIRGHAYSITRVKFVDIQTPNTSGKIPLLRLRNPWGNENEWRGPWSDQSPEWRFIPEHEKEDLGLTFDNDGEFWMSFKDFQTHFDRLEICNLTPDSLTEEELSEGHKKQWEMSVFEGEWVRGVTAGGCRNYLDTFWHNPQYRITLTDVDDDDDDSKCTVIVALMQKNRRSRRLMGVEFLTIGFAIYYLPDPNGVPKPLDHNYFKYNASVARSPSFINLREVSCRFRLPPGTYCIVPSTFDPNEEGEFLLRVFSEHKNNMEENDEEVGIGEVDTTVVKHAPTVEENQETDKVREFFLKLAGEDLEVDWQELKEILDYAMRNELPVNKASVRGVEAGVGGTEVNSESNSFFSELLGLICARFCKDTPLADIVPAPEPASTVELVPTSRSSYETNKGFSKDVCRSMVAMLDTDRSGKLGYEEFKNLWLDIRNWKLVFKMYDKDNSGALSGFELRQALHSAGYKLNNHILNILMHRYGSKSSELNFDDFILCAVKLKTMIELFKQKDPDGMNRASFSMEDWIETTLYC